MIDEYSAILLRFVGGAPNMTAIVIIMFSGVQRGMTLNLTT